MDKKIIFCVGILFSFLFSPLSFADESMCGEGLHKMVDSLKLDDAQKSKIKPILEQLKSTVKGDVVQIIEVKKQIHEQMWSDNANQSNLNSLIDKKVTLIGDIMKAKFKAKSEIIAVLNPQQKTELQNKMKMKEEQIEEKFKKCHDEE